MKIAVAGKGGVGKTLIAGTLCRLLGRDGYKVLAIDADPAVNLAYALGIPSQETIKIVPLTENKTLIEERVGSGPVYTLNPTVDDIADRFGILGPDNVRLLIMGTVSYGGSGCMCPANSLIQALIRHITLERKDIVVMDMEAGLEHLGRATVRGFDILMCIVNPGAQSIETAKKIRVLAADIGVKKALAVGNKTMKGEDVKFIEKSIEEIKMELTCVVPFDQKILEADVLGIAPLDFSPNSPAIKAIKGLKEILEEK